MSPQILVQPQQVNIESISNIFQQHDHMHYFMKFAKIVCFLEE